MGSCETTTISVSIPNSPNLPHSNEPSFNGSKNNLNKDLSSNSLHPVKYSNFQNNLNNSFGKLSKSVLEADLKIREKLFSFNSSSVNPNFLNRGNLQVNSNINKNNSMMKPDKNSLLNNGINHIIDTKNI